MRLTLSQADTVRYLTGDPEAHNIEEALLTWAQAADIREPIVVASADGQTLFAFAVDRGDV
jgi:hypothetical protein